MCIHGARFIILALLLQLIFACPNLAKQVERAPENHYVLADGLRLHYVVSGQGQPLILLHGNDGTLQDFTMSIFNNLSVKYKTIAFDRPGHGDSEAHWYRLLPPQAQARILHSAINKLGVNRPLLVAHSWSGALALSYALQFPNDLSGLVLLGSVAYDTKELEPKPFYYMSRLPIIRTAAAFTFMAIGKEEVKKELAKAFFPDVAPEPYVHNFLSSLCRLSQIRAAAYDEITLNPALKQMSSEYPDIHVPVIIVTGDHDKIVSPEKHSYPLHKAISQSHLVVVHNAGHELQFSCQREVMAAIDLAVSPSLKDCITVSAQ